MNIFLCEAMVSAILFPLYSVHIDVSLRYIFPNQDPPPPSKLIFFLLEPGDITSVLSTQPSTEHLLLKVSPSNRNLSSKSPKDTPMEHTSRKSKWKMALRIESLHLSLSNESCSSHVLLIHGFGYIRSSSSSSILDF